MANRSHHPLYPIYMAMIYRCQNPKHSKYKYYGGRGITVCERWLGEKGLENFLKDMGEKPTSKHSLDRMDNNYGYRPDNCHWATKEEQSANRRIRHNSKSGYKCVYQIANTQKWRAEIQRKGVVTYLGCFNSAYEASMAYEQAAKGRFCVNQKE